jgi:hypothetical protein
VSEDRCQKADNKAEGDIIPILIDIPAKKTDLRAIEAMHLIFI